MSEFWTGELWAKFMGGFAVGAALVLATPSGARAEVAVRAPAPALDMHSDKPLATAIFAGGCFWGVEGAFSHVKGVKRVVSGYAGGPRGRKQISYAQVSGGDTGFAEAVRLAYDPDQVSYGQLLQIFFSVIADPTTLNYQGPDHGTQYRSALFPLDAEQKRVADAYLRQLDRSGLWDRPVVTRVEPFTGFVDAEAEHQDFLRRNPGHPYIVRWDAPKLTALKRLYPDRWSARPAS